MIKASYKCKNCGKRFFRNTAINPKKDIELLMDSYIVDHSTLTDMIKEQVTHKCGPTRVGIAVFTGLDCSDNGEV